MKKTLVILFILSFAISWQSKAQFSENFDSGLPGSMTQVYITNSISWTNCGGDTGPATCPYNGAGSAHFYEGAYSGSKTALVTPVMDLSSGAYQLRFSHVQPVWSGDQNTLTVEISTDAGTNWTQVVEYTNDIPDWVDETIYLDNFNLSATTQFRFVGTIDWGYAIGLDDIVVEPQPSCLHVSDLSVSNITTDTAELSWVENGSATTWNIEYGTTGFTQGQGTTVVATNNPYTLTGLTASTEYDYYVQADCGGGDTSTWKGPYTFITACPTITSFPYTYGFEDITANNNADWTNSCWSGNPENIENIAYNPIYRWNPEDNVSAWNTGPAGAHTGSMYAYAEPYGANNGDVAELVSPVFDMSSLTLPQLSFYYHMYGNDMGSLYVDTYDGTAWSEGAWTISGEQQTSNTDPWHLVFVSIPNTITKIRFRAIRGGRNSGIAVDDITLQETPSCQYPTDLSASAVSSNATNLSWSANGATVWNLEYGPTGFAQGSGTLVNGITTNSYTVSGLASRNNYDFYVQADCATGGGGGTSIWIGPFTWTQYDYGDDCSLPIPATVVPDCNQASSMALDFSVANSEYYPSCDTSSNYGYWVKVTVPPSGTFAVIHSSVYHYGLAAFDACGGTELYCSDDVSTSPHLQFPNLIGSDVWLYLWKNTRSGIDHFCFEEVNCLFPSDLSVDNVSKTTADLTWTENGSATTWDIKYGEKGFAQNGGQSTVINNVTSNAYTLTGLSNGTAYDFYVRADCGGGDTSSWAGPYTFCTIQAIPWSNIFNSFDFTCWDNTGTSTYVWETDDGMTHGPGETSIGNYALMFDVYNAPRGATATLTTPVFDMTNISHPELSFDYWMNGPADPDLWLKVEMSTDGTTWNEIFYQQQDGSINKWTNATIRLSGTTAATRLRFTASSDNGSYNTFLDYLTISCPAPVGLSVTNLTANSSDLSWTPGDNETLWNVSYDYETAYPGAGNIRYGVTTNHLTTSGLRPRNNYQFYVQADCGGGITSRWAGPYTWRQHNEGDDCSFPILATVVHDCSQATPLTLDFYYSDSEYFPSCNSMDNHGFWIKLTWPASGSLNINHTGGDIGLTILDGCDGSELYCINNATIINDQSLIGTDILLYLWKDTSFSGRTDICFEDGTSGIANELTNITDIYPNPTTGEFVIKSHDLNDADVFVFTITGKEIYHSTIDKDTYTVDLKGVKKGVYFIKITSEDKSHITKLIIK